MYMESLAKNIIWKKSLMCVIFRKSIITE